MGLSEVLRQREFVLWGLSGTSRELVFSVLGCAVLLYFVAILLRTTFRLPALISRARQPRTIQNRAGRRASWQAALLVPYLAVIGAVTWMIAEVLTGWQLFSTFNAIVVLASALVLFLSATSYHRPTLISDTRNCFGLLVLVEALASVNPYPLDLEIMFFVAATVFVGIVRSPWLARLVQDRPSATALAFLAGTVLYAAWLVPGAYMTVSDWTPANAATMADNLLLPILVLPVLHPVHLLINALLEGRRVFLDDPPWPVSPRPGAA